MKKKKIHPMIKTALEVKISIDDARFILRESSNLPEKNHDFFGLMLIAVHLFKSDNIKESSAKCFAFTERLKCLWEVLDSPQMNAWKKESGLDDDSFLLHAAAIDAMVLCPLKYNENTEKTYFDEGEFLNLVLTHADAEGKA